ncbi:MAG: hypothetical protein JW716_02010 [Candidatus Aenigmarchaeota archaeon]|nr:hypothetical protein [Candidatus Aenigmarchaeota archaeon]
MDIIDIVAEFLKIDQATVDSAMNQGVMQGIFHLFFFPTVFLIMFVMILMNKRGTGRKDLDMLITVSIYAFILMSGYYKYFVWMSTYWLYLLIFLGAIYVITHHTSKSNGGGGGKQMPGFGGNATGFGKVMNLAKGDPLGIKGEIAQLEVDLVRVQRNPGGANELNKSISTRMAQIRGLIDNDPRGAVYKNDLRKLEALARK